MSSANHAWCNSGQNCKHQSGSTNASFVNQCGRKTGTIKGHFTRIGTARKEEVHRCEERILLSTQQGFFSPPNLLMNLKSCSCFSARGCHPTEQAAPWDQWAFSCLVLPTVAGACPCGQGWALQAWTPQGNGSFISISSSKRHWEAWDEGKL